jgi:hypothetical protein
MAGRTHGVQALPITFGHKCAVWLDEVGRHHERLQECAPRVLVGMVAGAVGSQGQSLGPQADERWRSCTLDKLGLGAPAISWAPARDRFAEYANLLAMLGGTLVQDRQRAVQPAAQRVRRGGGRPSAKASSVRRPCRTSATPPRPRTWPAWRARCATTPR